MVAVRKGDGDGHKRLQRLLGKERVQAASAVEPTEAPVWWVRGAGWLFRRGLAGGRGRRRKKGILILVRVRRCRGGWG